MAGLNKESLKEWKKEHQEANKKEPDFAEPQERKPSTQEQVDEFNSLTKGDFENFDPNA